MSTLEVVEDVLREVAIPMTVREIVNKAGSRLPSKSRTPDTVVARDLSLDIKRKGDDSLFIRTSPGRYTLRALALGSPSDRPIDRPMDRPTAVPVAAPVNDGTTPVLSHLRSGERAATLPAARSSSEQPERGAGPGVRLA